jgi:outer membrane immunogenic protein
MKKLLIAGAALATLIGTPALAADLARPVYKAPPAVAPVIYSWTGFYIGGNVGGSWSTDSVTSTLVPGGAIPGLGGIFGVPSNIALANALGTGSLNGNGAFTGGGQIGYNYQIGRNWLVGVEGDFNSLSPNRTLTGTGVSTIGPLTITNSVNTHWLATARGRLGATFDRLLIYVTGGAAFTDQKYTQTFNLASAPPAFGTSSVRSTNAGWTVGGGAEWAIWGAWSVKAEYLYAQFKGLNTTTLVCAPNCAAPAFAQNYLGSTNHLGVNIARVGLNYRFGGPVVAGY